MKRFLLALLISPAVLGATYNVALPGGGVLTVNGAAYTNPAITNSASVVWGVDGAGFLYATATGTNSSIIYVEGSAVAGPNFGLSTEVDPVVTAATNITFSLVNSSITTNKIDATFYSLLTASSGGGLGTNAFVNNVLFQPFKLTNDPAATGGVIFITNAGGDVTAYATNLPASGSGQGTNAFVNNVLFQPFRLTNGIAVTGGVAWYTNASGDVLAYATNLPSATGGNVYTSSNNIFTAANNFTNSYIRVQGDNSGPQPSTGEGFEIRYDADDGTYGANGLASLAAYDRLNSLWTDARIMAAAIVLAPSGTALMTLTNGRVVTAGQLSVVDDPYAAAWDTSLNVPTKNAVYDKIQTLSSGLAYLSSNNTWTGTNTYTAPTIYSSMTITNLTLVNPMPNYAVTNATASRFAVWGADYRLTNDVAETGTGAPVRATAPTFAGATLNDTVTFEQTVLSAHSDSTNFVADPTVSPYQTVNADLTLPFAGIRFLHATNVAAGRQTTVLVFAGTNAAVTVALNSQFAFNTNLVSLTTGQVLPVSFYGYGSSPTNVVATLGTIYTR